MRFFIVFITLCYFLVPIHGYCDGLTAEKKAAIKKMLQITGASEMGTLMGTAIAQNLIQTYKRSNPDIDPKAFDIINEEIMAAFHEEFVVKESFYPYIYPLYDKYLSLEELKEINRFYQTPIGQKAITAGAIIAKESIPVGQEWALKVFPPIRQKLMDRFKKEGIEF